jgi:hypothetical protein
MQKGVEENGKYFLLQTFRTKIDLFCVNSVVSCGLICVAYFPTYECNLLIDS